jgi:hypothetical protein
MFTIQSKFAVRTERSRTLNRPGDKLPPRSWTGVDPLRWTGDGLILKPFLIQPMALS